MNCTLENREALIEAYLLRKLSETETEAFEHHFFGCRECAEELSVRRQLIEALKTEKSVRAAETPVSRLLRGRSTYWPYLAAAALVIGMILLPRLFNSQAPEIRVENFAENSQLESFLEQNVKNPAFSLTVLSPQTGENLQGKIVFAWEASHHDESYTGHLDLVIMNNQRTDVLRKTVQGGRFQLESKLIPGRYYWTLEYQNETVHVGKFFVGKPQE